MVHGKDIRKIAGLYVNPCIIHSDKYEQMEANVATNFIVTVWIFETLWAALGISELYKTRLSAFNTSTFHERRG
jgi:hypothetical protein